MVYLLIDIFLADSINGRLILYCYIILFMIHSEFPQYVACRLYLCCGNVGSQYLLVVTIDHHLTHVNKLHSYVNMPISLRVNVRRSRILLVIRSVCYNNINSNAKKLVSNCVYNIGPSKSYDD